MRLLSRTIKTIGTIVFAASMTYSANISAATAPVPSIVISGGEITGINNVNVTGYGLFDMTFNSLYQNTLYDQNFANNANRAAFDVIHTGALANTLIDFQAEPVTGCGIGASATGQYGRCDWFTAVTELAPGILYQGNTVRNYSQPRGNDEIIEYYVALNQPVDGLTFVDWTPSQHISEVPVPAAAILFAPALFGFLGFRRKIRN